MSARLNYTKRMPYLDSGVRVHRGYSRYLAAFGLTMLVVGFICGLLLGLAL